MKVADGRTDVSVDRSGGTLEGETNYPVLAILALDGQVRATSSGPPI